MPKGKFGYGKGKGGILKRRRNSLVDVYEGIRKPAIQRLARRGGVKRIGGNTYDETRAYMKKLVEKIVQDAVIYCEHARRKTMYASDIIYAMKRHGIHLYHTDMKNK